MELVAIVIGLALIEYLYLTMKCGQARGRLGVPAPSTTGNAEFERRFRVQYNTIEQLAIFLPAILLFGHYVSAPVGAGLGLVFILGRALYARGYVIDPAKRGPGFGLTLLANVVLLVGGLVGALLSYLR
jgi:glutathione S-transferase